LGSFSSPLSSLPAAAAALREPPIITIRRVNNTTGDGADAILTRAQHELEDGDLEAAVADLDKLPPPARAALSGWRDRAQRRLEIDRQVAAIRTAAMRDLSLSAGARP